MIILDKKYPNNYWQDICKKGSIFVIQLKPNLIQNIICNKNMSRVKYFFSFLILVFLKFYFSLWDDNWLWQFCTLIANLSHTNMVKSSACVPSLISITFYEKKKRKMKNSGQMACFVYFHILTANEKTLKAFDSFSEWAGDWRTGYMCKSLK